MFTMNNDILALKYRPKFFHEVTGQNEVVETIQSSIKLEKIHHAYLFSGTRGMGKTTIARLFAKILLCEKGVSEEPCGDCSSCKEIDDTNQIDLIEIDAASRTKVEDTRSLMENVQYAPTKSRFKIYLIDEVHMLSTKSFNALLKTIEEPPSHVKFLLATTEAEKLPDTILSRCLHFRLKSASNDIIISHLEKILQSEDIKYEKEALTIIAKNSYGSIRDSLSILERCITYCQKNIQTEKVLKLLGNIDLATIDNLVLYLNNKDEKSVIEAIENIDESTNYINVIDQLIEKFFALIYDDISNTKDNKAKFAREDIHLIYQILVSSKKDYVYAPDKKDYLIMILLRIIQFSNNNEFISDDIHSKYDEHKLNNNDISNDIVEQDNQKNTNNDDSQESPWHETYVNLNLDGLLLHLASHSVFIIDETSNEHFLKISLHKKDVYPETCINDLIKVIKKHYSIDGKISVIYADNLLTPMALNAKSEKIDIEKRYDRIKDNPDINKLKKVFNADIEKASIKKITE